MYQAAQSPRQPAYPQPAAPKGFAHINRYWDPRQGVYAAKILPGQFYVSTAGEMIVTVLGSCIAACIRDRVTGIGGMNHFMLPIMREDRRDLAPISESARYGNWAMEYLINEIFKNGGRKENLEVKVFGGGKVLSNMNLIDVGNKNIDFIHMYLQSEGLRIVSEDVGDVYPRKVLYFPDTGSVKVRKLKSTRNDVLVEREQQYAKSINTRPPQGDVELF